jgi:hypothetical protein
VAQFEVLMLEVLSVEPVRKMIIVVHRAELWISKVCKLDVWWKL